MSSFGSIKEGWLVKQGGERKNWKKRWFLLQDNILYYFAHQTDEMSKGSIPLAKVTKVQIQEHKKKFIFEIHTNIENRIFFVQAESEQLLKDWVDAITTAWELHTLKDKHKDRFFHGADTYSHTLITVGKRILTCLVRVTGVTKAVITGGGRAHKAKPAEALTIMTDNAQLGNLCLDFCKTILLTEKDPYKVEVRKQLENQAELIIRAAELIAGRGAGSVNEGALKATSKQLVTEVENLIKQTYPPSFKTNMLYLVQMHAQIIEKYAEASNTDLKINESRRLEALGNAFPIIAKEIFPHISDLTYAQPLVDNAALVPLVTRDVKELVKTAAVYTQGETYASNSCKTLFYLLNQLRRIMMDAFPASPYDDKFPQVGPPDAQFQLSSEEFNTNIQATVNLTASPVAETTTYTEGVSFDEFGIPPPPPEDPSFAEEYPPPGEPNLLASGSVFSDSTSSVPSFSSDPVNLSDQFDALLDDFASVGSQKLPDKKAINPSQARSSSPMATSRPAAIANSMAANNGMLVGSAPAASTMNRSPIAAKQTGMLSTSGHTPILSSAQPISIQAGVRPPNNTPIVGSPMSNHSSPSFGSNVSTPIIGTPPSTGLPILGNTGSPNTSRLSGNFMITPGMATPPPPLAGVTATPPPPLIPQSSPPSGKISITVGQPITMPIPNIAPPPMFATPPVGQPKLPTAPVPATPPFMNGASASPGSVKLPTAPLPATPPFMNGSPASPASGKLPTAPLPATPPFMNGASASPGSGKLPTTPLPATPPFMNGGSASPGSGKLPLFQPPSVPPPVAQSPAKISISQGLPALPPTPMVPGTASPGSGKIPFFAPPTIPGALPPTQPIPTPSISQPMPAIPATPPLASSIGQQFQSEEAIAQQKLKEQQALAELSKLSW